MIKRFPLILVLPTAVAAIGIVILLFGYWDHRREIEEVERLFSAHVDSVAQLVKEGAREAAASTSLIYEITEEHLLSSAELLSNALPPTSDSDIVVRLLLENGELKGHFGPIPESRRADFTQWMIESPPNTLVDDGPLRDLGLACILQRKFSDSASIVCHDADNLSLLRQEIGIGPLLKGIIKKDILYVALQDREGILAVAPSPEHVSKWHDDPFLSKVLDTSMDSGISRLRVVGNRTVFEGLIPFAMADESTVLLRVGIDAAPLQRVQRSAGRRFTIMVGLVLGVFLLSAAVAWLIRYWQRKRDEMRQIFEAREAERKHWETIGQMSATVAHEVRNPLNTVGMISQRLKREFSIRKEEQKEFDEMIGILISESERVGRFVTEFLELGKPLILERQPVNARDAVKDAILPLQMRAETENKTIELQDRSTGEVELDQNRFRQIIANLVGNALDAAPDNGWVKLRTESTERDYRVEITDNGPGIPQEKLGSVTKPFVSFKSTGTGLGLPLVKRIIEAHGGRFELSSSQGGGTIASFVIPRKARNQD